MTRLQQLHEIDQHLISLLQERISILDECGPPSTREQIFRCRPLLTQTGLPESLWENVVTGCLAALKSRPPEQPTQPTRQVVVVGGHGIMGRFFVERLSASGHTVRILERGDWDEADTILAGADLVLLCVPLHHTIDIVEQVASHLQPTTALVDVASIKTPIVEAMLEHHPGPVLGLHPMFGPGVTSFLSQRVVVCPGRQAKAFQWFLDWIEADGGTLTLSTPAEHDRMMVIIQAIRQFVTFSLGAFLAQEQIDVKRTLDFASPIYRMELNLVSRLFMQNPSLCAEIMLASDDCCDAVDRLAQTCNRLAHLLAQQDRNALISEFEHIRAVFQGEAPRALEESNHLLSTLSTLLAAKAVEGQSRSPGSSDSQPQPPLGISATG